MSSPTIASATRFPALPPLSTSTSTTCSSDSQTECDTPPRSPSSSSAGQTPIIRIFDPAQERKQQAASARPKFTRGASYDYPTRESAKENDERGYDSEIDIKKKRSIRSMRPRLRTVDQRNEGGSVFSDETSEATTSNDSAASLPSSSVEAATTHSADVSSSAATPRRPLGLGIGNPMSPLQSSFTSPSARSASALSLLRFSNTDGAPTEPTTSFSSPSGRGIGLGLGLPSSLPQASIITPSSRPSSLAHTPFLARTNSNQLLCPPAPRLSSEPFLLPIDPSPLNLPSPPPFRRFSAPARPFSVASFLSGAPDNAPDAAESWNPYFSSVFYDDEVQ